MDAMHTRGAFEQYTISPIASLAAFTEQTDKGCGSLGATNASKHFLIG